MVPARSRGLVLFVPHFNTSFRDMLPVALHLRDRWDLTPHFLIHRWPSEEAVTECRRLGLPFTLTGGASKGSPNSHGPRGRLPKGVRRVLKSLPWMPEVRLVSQLARTHRAMHRRALHLLRTLRPSCLVLFDDRHPNLDAHLIKVAHRLGIPTLLTPHESVDPPELFYEERLSRGWAVSNLPADRHLILALARLWMPGLTARWQGVEVFWLPPEQALMGHLFGVFPRQPWVRGGGHTDWFAVQNEEYRCLLVANGVPEEKLLVTGYPPHDALALTLEQKEELKRQLAIPPEAVTVAFADEITDQYRVYGDLEAFIRDTLAVVRGLLDLSPRLWLLFKVHPRNRRTDFLQAMPIHPRLRVLRDMDIRLVTAISDIFVTYISSTVYGALALNKPVVAYDFQNTRIFDLMLAPLNKPYRCRDLGTFLDTMSSLMKAAWSKPQGTESTGTGGATERLALVIKALSERPPNDPRRELAASVVQDPGLLRTLN